ncbi:MAG TPA: hypothetical protein DEQ38_10055 [Elusimicrobia bacterium]|nr:hypothetical protein [Elusimicrobiota bacterium]
MEEQVNHISDLEGLNSELDGFLADLHGREEGLSSRVKALEEELNGARSSAAAELNRLAGKEASLTAALEGVRSTLARESSKNLSLVSERDDLARKLDAASRLLEETKSSLADKEALLNDTRAAVKAKAAELSAAMEEARAAMLGESSKVSALTSERETLARRLETVSARLEEAKAAVADKDAALKEARSSAKEETAKASALAEELRAGLLNESARVSALTSEKDGLLRQLQDLASRLEEARAAAADKDALLKEARAAAKEEASKLSAAVEEARTALAKENSRLSAVTLDRDDLARRLQSANELLDEAKAALADKDALLKETRAAAREKAAELASALDQSRAALQDEVTKLGGLLTERDGLLRRLEDYAKLLEEEKTGSAKKEVLIKEARSAAKDKAAELTAAMEQVRSSLSEQGAKAAELASERDGLLRQLSDSAELYEEEKAASARADEALKEARAAAKDKAAELGAVIEQLKISIADSEAKAAALASERDGLLRKLEAEARLLDGEKARSAEKEQLINRARADLKGKDEEIDKILRGVEELKADLTIERANVKDRELQLQKAAKIREALEKKLELASQENTRSEEGYLLKVDLVKKELREQGRRAEELERKLAAAGARLEDALGETVKKEKMISELSAALAEKEAQLKDANQKLKEITKEFTEIKGGAGHENAARAREVAAAMAARVEELENSLAQASAHHMEKFRSLQIELSSVKADLRSKEEENAFLRAREDTISKELGDAEEKWKFATAQLNNSASKLRNAENENEIILGRLKSVEEERDKFRAAAIKAETASAAMAARESKARDGEAAGLMAALEEQAAKYTELLRKYDEVALLNETFAREKAGLKAEAESLRDALTLAQASADADAGEKRGLQSGLAEKLRGAEALLKKKEFELEETRGALSELESECSLLRQGRAGMDAQAEKYSGLMRKFNEVSLANENLAREKTAVKAEADSLRSALKAAEEAADADAGEKRGLWAGLSEKLRAAEAKLKKKEFEVEEALSAASTASMEAEELRSRLEEKEDMAAGEAEAEKARYAVLSEKMHNAEALLKKKEFELDEAREALSSLDKECGLLRASRAALGEKYAREIQSENELLKEAQGRIIERDSLISRLSMTEEELKKEADALRKEKQSLLSLVRKKASGGAHTAKVSEAERLLAEKESRLVKLRSELENTRAEKAELQGREKELREELKARPYRAMLREAEEKLLIKEKMLADMGARMKRIGHDFEELKVRGQSSGAPGYLPDFEELVAGVAHQVANSISIIRSHAEFCSEAPDSEGARESLDVIVRNIVNLQKKIDIIMNFSRPVIPQRSPERLSAVLFEVLDGLRAGGRLEKITVTARGGEKFKPVSLDRVRFASAVEQLLLNAAEAMPEGGQLSATISASGGKQRLEISDTGPGIEKKNLGSVFHPFFTTKPGKMGLGLTLSRNVVRAHGGTLEILSEPGKGTRAVLELPES